MAVSLLPRSGQPRSECGVPPGWLATHGPWSVVAGTRRTPFQMRVLVAPSMPCGSRASAPGFRPVPRDRSIISIPSLADTWSKRISGATLGELDGAENAAVGLGADVCLERGGGFPPLDQHDGLLRAMLLEDLAARAARLGQHRLLDGPQDLQHLGAPVRQRQDPERSDDHAEVTVHDPCRGRRDRATAAPKLIAVTG